MSDKPLFREKVGELGGHQIDLVVEVIDVERVEKGSITFNVRHRLIGIWPNWIVKFKNDETYNEIESPPEPYLPQLAKALEKFVKENKDTIFSSVTIDVENLGFSGAYTAGTSGWHCKVTVPVKALKVAVKV